MAPLKRKRPHDELPEPQTRRATRQTPATAAPLAVEPKSQPRRGRPARVDHVAKKRTSDGHDKGALRVVNGGSLPNQRSERAMQRSAAAAAAATATAAAVPPEALKTTRTTRHSGGSAGSAAAGNENIQPGFMPTSPGKTPVPAPATVPPASLRPPSRNVQLLKQTLTTQHPPTAAATATTTSRATPKSAAASAPTASNQKKKRAAPTPEKKPSSRSDRNIDKVVLGNICFRAWYPSYYGKEVLGDISGNSIKGNHNVGGVNGGSAKEEGAKSLARRDRDHPPILDRLYVCPCCFKYSKELVMWWEHVRVCERRGFIPGEKIYVHPKGRRAVPVPVAAAGPSRGPRKRRADSGAAVPVDLVQDEGEWSIWEVDGEKDVLFCQNLSLFAKLFLDNKSVFFDVTGFNYFLLVYKPPSPDGEDVENSTAKYHIVGFFSKEKMSWDNNNLACILIFPPWQRKGLGALLMGVSYEISRREGVLGGPEKPISDLGKKGYKRFWAGEIARWLLSLDGPRDEAETMVDVGDCSKATWIAPEDCLLVLREMSVAEDAGMGPPKGQQISSAEDEDEEGAAAAAAKEAEEPKLVPRVKVSKAAVRQWVAANGLSLQRSCDPDGFVEGYATKAVPEEEES